MPSYRTQPRKAGHGAARVSTVALILGTDSLQTHRWRGMDSNLQYAGTVVRADRFAGNHRRGCCGSGCGSHRAQIEAGPVDAVVPGKYGMDRRSAARSLAPCGRARTITGTRRLAAIVAADVAGYSRLWGGGGRHACSLDRKTLGQWGAMRGKAMAHLLSGPLVAP